MSCACEFPSSAAARYSETDVSSSCWAEAGREDHDASPRSTNRSIIGRFFINRVAHRFKYRFNSGSDWLLNRYIDSNIVSTRTLIGY